MASSVNDKFSSWCNEQYLKTGKALLVSSSYVPELQKPDKQAKLAIQVVAMKNVEAFGLDRHASAC